jgi:hypothetical protein
VARLDRQQGGQFVGLFGFALALHLALPLARGVGWLDFALGLALAGLLGYAGWLTLEHPLARRVYTALIVGSLASTASTLASGSTWPMLFLGYHAALICLSTVLVIRWTIVRVHITVDTIFAALSGYFLMGFCWALAYALVDHVLAGAFSVPLVDGHTLDRAFYFSFVTLTTLGYGDIVPTHPITRAMISSEALIGQVYLVVLVARLVALWGPREQT